MTGAARMSEKNRVAMLSSLLPLEAAGGVCRARSAGVCVLSAGCGVSGAPLQALATYNPAAARVATPLAFFTYGPAARPYVAVQLHKPAAWRWDEYTFLKPMTLDAAAGGVAVVPLAHLYDRLRPLPHWERRARAPSRTTVHVTVGFK